MKTIVTAPSPKPKIRPPTSNASPSLDGSSDASDSARSCSSSPKSVRAVELLEEVRGRGCARRSIGRSSIRSRTAPTNGRDEQVGEADDAGDEAEHDDRRGVPALHRRALLEPRDGRLEDDREEERDEHPEHRLARRDERPRRRRTTPRIVSDRSQRDEDLDALRRRLGSRHEASLGPAPEVASLACARRVRRVRCGRRRSRFGRAARRLAFVRPARRRHRAPSVTVPLTDCTSSQSARPRTHRDRRRHPRRC